MSEVREASEVSYVTNIYHGHEITTAVSSDPKVPAKFLMDGREFETLALAIKEAKQNPIQEVQAEPVAEAAAPAEPAAPESPEAAAPATPETATTTTPEVTTHDVAS